MGKPRVKKISQASVRAAFESAGFADGVRSFRDFVALALYHDDIGYYRQPRLRVGRAEGTDFYTAESQGTVFGRLIAASADELLGDLSTAATTFVEIAAEPGMALAERTPQLRESFAAHETRRLGDPLTGIPSPAFVFANEWLDALPFHRLRFREGAWHELGVALQPHSEAAGESGVQLVETELEEPSEEIRREWHRLPAAMPEGYCFDWPLEAERALAELARQPWRGAILTFDYGKPWETLLSEHPDGTARAYRQHRQSNDLLADPGEQDLTLHLAWDPLARILRNCGFDPVEVERQEKFLVTRAAPAVRSILESSSHRFSAGKQTLMELMHPANMGAKFQALWGRRKSVPAAT